PELQRRPWLDGDHSARAEVDALGLVAEQHGHRPRDDHEGLLLRVIPVAPAGRVRRIAPEPRPGLLEPQRLGQVAGAARLGLALLLGALDVLEVVGARPPVGHAAGSVSTGSSTSTAAGASSSIRVAAS